MNRNHQAVLLALAFVGMLPAQEAKPALPGPGRIEGIVLDAMGRPVADADVRLINEAVPHVRTDGKGCFGFSRLQVGYHFARAQVRGWSSVNGRASITHDNPFQYSQVTLLPAADLDVRVVDKQGAAVAGAEVMPSRTAAPGHYWGERGERFVTDASGKLRLQDLSLGLTAVNVWAPGFGFGSALCYVGDGTEVVVTLPTTEAVTLKLVLTGASAQQIRGSRWTLYAMRDGYGAGCGLPPSLAGGVIGDDGTVTIKGLPFDMGLREIGIVTDSAAVSPSRVSLEPAKATAQLTQELQYQVVPTAETSLSGVVLDPDGKPLPRLMLLCRTFQATSSRDQETRTDPGGGFSIPRAAAAGDGFRLTSLDPMWVFDQGKDDLFNTIRYRRTFEGKVKPDHRFEVRCVRASSVNGRIVDASGRGVAGADVRFMAAWQNGRNLDVAWVVSDRDGLFALPRLNGVDEREAWIEAYSRQGNARSEVFKMGVGKVVELGELKVEAAGVVEGTVRDSKGTPVYGASVRLIRDTEGEEADETISDRDGRFRLVAGAGAYRFVCHCVHDKDGSSQSQVLNLRSGEKVELTLTRERR